MKELGPNGYSLCKNGHEFTPDNFIGGRCKECQKIYRHEYYLKNKSREYEIHKQYVANNRKSVTDKNKRWRNNHKKSDSYKCALNIQNKKRIENMTNCYITSLLGTSVSECHNDIIEIKKIMLSIKRAKRRFKNEQVRVTA